MCHQPPLPGKPDRISDLNKFVSGLQRASHQASLEHGRRTCAKVPSVPTTHAAGQGHRNGNEVRIARVHGEFLESLGRYEAAVASYQKMMPFALNHGGDAAAST